VVIGVGAQVGRDRGSQFIEKAGEYLSRREGVVLDLVHALVVAHAGRWRAARGVVVIEICGIEVMARHGATYSMGVDVA
jgi:transcription elongation factor